MRRLLITLLFALTGPALQASDARIAFLGDSITYDGRWPALVESALRATPQFADADIVNLGLPSETVSGLSEEGHAGGQFPRPCLHERLERVLAAFEPTLVLACYGMNDGIYLPPDQTRLEAFQNGILRLKAAVEKHGARIIYITPPLYQPGNALDDPTRYDAVLDGYGDWLVSRRASGWQVVDIRPALKQAVARAQAGNPAFVYAGDGVHPGDDGHRFIADAVCKELWPLLNLSDPARFAEDTALSILKQRQNLLRDAWLSKTRHLRPGIPAGLPLEQAREKAATLLSDYRAAIARAGEATPAKVSQWSGNERLDFEVDGRAALLADTAEGLRVYGTAGARL
jgi:lysophospholipase L1-like esterase